ncbi:uncharacterized protein LOC128204586 [Mya arenaria]|uniref:uncharacterized protein LOC128204586 n=1 Tax=Mya arenaria TaxID=6604 RepID=UPI0022E7782B|nr:uncharacterized protein LOC128204586 [Mya arenaria]
MFSTLYATANRERASQAEHANGVSDNLNSVIIIEYPNHQSQPTDRFCKKMTPLLTADDLEIDEDDAFARENAVKFEESGGVYYNNAVEVSKFKLRSADLPAYVHSISLKDLEKEFQKIPYGLVKVYEVSQTKLNMHRKRFNGIYPYDDKRVLVRGGETDYINASYIDGFRKQNAYISTLGNVTYFFFTESTILELNNIS